MPQAVVTDADMLFGSTTRALFIHLDYADVIRVHWSQRILTEMSEALLKTGRKSSMASALEHERLMNASVETAMVDPALVDRHEAAMRAYVHDGDDAHVVACAYELVTGGYYPAAGTVILSTRNLADYRVEALESLGIAVLHPDVLLANLPLAAVAAALRAWRGTLDSRPDAVRVLARLEKDGNPRIAAALRAGLVAGTLAL